MPRLEREGKDDDGDEEEDGGMPEEGSEIPPSLMRGSYNQTYIILDGPGPGLGTVREVMFRCGNWCYVGEVSFAGIGDEITLSDVSRAIPMLQKQQGRLKFYCTAANIPSASPFAEPSQVLQKSQDFIAAQLSSSRLQNELFDMAEKLPWIEESGVYFEMTGDLGADLEGITLVASKTYARGLVIISVYFEGSFYVVLQDGEGDQALLDIRFPDVSSQGQGLHLRTFPHDCKPWHKLTLWQSLGGGGKGNVGKRGGKGERSKGLCSSLTSDRYIQTYVVMQPNRGGNATNAIYRDVLFRFGSWCYAGTVQLTPVLALADVPHVIPALRMQQSRLDFVFDVGAIPERSPYSKTLRYLMSIVPAMEDEIIASEDVITKLLEKLSSMGLASSVEDWFVGSDGAQSSFFEFNVAADEEYLEAFKGVDLVASKAYTPQGVVLMTLWFQNMFYVVLSDGAAEQPLLDSRFPDVSSKGRGYQISSSPEGRSDWPQLRKVSVWQSACSVAEAALRKGSTRQNAEAEEAEIVGGNGERTELEGREDVRSMSARESDSRRRSSRSSSSSAAGAAGGAASGGGDGGGDHHHHQSSKPGARKLGEESKLAEADSKEEFRRGGEAHDTISGGGGGSLGDSRGQLDPAAEEKVDPAAETLKAGQDWRSMAAKQLTGTRVAMPHHIAPLRKDSLESTGLESRLERMRQEMSQGSSAPWDEFGRPRSKLATSNGCDDGTRAAESKEFK